MSDEPLEPEPGEKELDELIRTMPRSIRQHFFSGEHIDVVALCVWIWRDGQKVGWNDKPVRTLSGGNSIVPRLLRDRWLQRGRK